MLDIVTREFEDIDEANMNNIAVQAGLILDTAKRVDDGPARLNPDSKGSASFHSCATGLRAYIMNVTFRINGTSLLENLQVVTTTPRTYASNASIPLWAVENTDMKIMNVASFGVIINDEYESRPHLGTMRKGHLYMLAESGLRQLSLNVDRATASAHAPQSALTIAYDVEGFTTSPTKKLPDYSELKNYPLFLKGKELAQNLNNTPTIVNLIWTDIMTNYVLDTRSIEKDAARPLIRVRRFEFKVQYDMLYVIPAIIFLIFYVITIIFEFLFGLIGRVPFQQLRTLLN